MCAEPRVTAGEQEEYSNHRTCLGEMRRKAAPAIAARALRALGEDHHAMAMRRASILRMAAIGPASGVSCGRGTRARQEPKDLAFEDRCGALIGMRAVRQAPISERPSDTDRRARGPLAQMRLAGKAPRAVWSCVMLSAQPLASPCPTSRSAVRATSSRKTSVYRSVARTCR